MVKGTRRGGRYNRRSTRTALEMLMRPQQTLLGRVVSWLIRLRVEIFLIITVWLVWSWITSVMAEWVAYTVLATVLAVVVGVPAVRRYVTRRFWCVFARHRVKICFEQTRTMTYDGKMPSLIWSRPTPVGERIRVWLPAGLSVNDLERVTENLAVACFAESARIEPGRKAFLVSILIVRRDTLGSRDVSPDLLGQVNPADVDEPTNVVRLPRREDVLADLATQQHATVAEPIEHTKPAARGGSRKSRNEPNDTEPAVRGFEGMDVSDYV